MHLRAWLLGLMVLSLASSLSAASDEQVDQAIQRMKRYFYATQDPRSGGWPQLVYDNGPQHGGETALATLAMLMAGESPQDPRLARAIDYLKNAQLTGTYAVALRAHVWAQLSDDYHALLENDAKWLLAAADAQSRFRYGAEREGHANHSTTHYGILGLWESAKRGVAVPANFWDQAQRSFLEERNRDGGWGYEDATPSYGSMTAAGLTALLIAQQQLYHDRVKPQPQIARAIDEGLRWLDTRFDGNLNPGSAGWSYYYLYAVERVALASGVRFLNKQDWFAAGAQFILNEQVADDGSAKAGSIGGDPIDTAFALLFLARGRVPIWATKLALTGQASNNRPNDLNALTNYLSDLHEAEVNWQTLSIDAPPEQWLATPLVYLASDEALELTGAQKQAIKRYLDLGGTLLANPDDGSEKFSRSIRALAQELYPQGSMRKIPPEHPLFSVLHHVPNAAGQLSGLSNGTRELILLAERDWGFAWQAEQPAGNSLAWKVAANLWGLISDRGLLPNRLVERFEAKQPRERTGRLAIGRAIYTADPALSLPEPAAWEPLANHLFNRTGLEIALRDIALEQIGDSDLPLIHVTGIEPVELTDAQRRALAAYIKRGGTLLVETVGGQGLFAAAFEKDLTLALGGVYAPLTADEPIISGRGIQGGYDNRTPAYRRFAVKTLGATQRPRLGAYFVDSRPAAIISREDLSQGVLGINHWGILGYQPDTARRLMTNIVLWAAQRKKSG